MFSAQRLSSVGLGIDARSFRDEQRHDYRYKES